MLCECGCGIETRASAVTYARRGYVKGQPHRFVKGHHERVAQPKSYRRVTIRGRLSRIHRLRAERALGRPLPSGAVVHHVDGSTSDDAPLVICQDDRYHQFLHARARVLALGGNPHTERACTGCQQPKPFSEFYPYRRTGKLELLRSQCKACVQIQNRARAL